MGRGPNPVNGGRIWRRNRKGVEWAKDYFIVAAFFPIIGAIALSCDNLHTKLADSILTDIWKTWVAQIFWSVVWYKYLTNADRVKNTYEIVEQDPVDDDSEATEADEKSNPLLVVVLSTTTLLVLIWLLTRVWMSTRAS